LLTFSHGSVLRTRSGPTRTVARLENAGSATATARIDLRRYNSPWAKAVAHVWAGQASRCRRPGSAELRNRLAAMIIFCRFKSLLSSRLSQPP
jgi:hypothetical protein